jgi:hypothetical protein
LRNPIERLVSFYHYAKKMPKHHLHQEVASGRMSIVGLAEKIANQHVRYLCGMTGGVPEPKDLELAKVNIEQRFVAAGLTERFDETVAMFQLKLGWPLRGYTRENVNAAKPRQNTLSEEELRAVRACNELDYKLYEWVARRFDEQVEQEGEALHKQVRALRGASRVARIISGLTRPFRRH